MGQTLPKIRQEMMPTVLSDNRILMGLGMTCTTGEPEYTKRYDHDVISTQYLTEMVNNMGGFTMPPDLVYDSESAIRMMIQKQMQQNKTTETDVTDVTDATETDVTEVTDVTDVTDVTETDVTEVTDVTDVTE